MAESILRLVLFLVFFLGRSGVERQVTPKALPAVPSNARIHVQHRRRRELLHQASHARLLSDRFRSSANLPALHALELSPLTQFQSIETPLALIGADHF